MARRIASLEPEHYTRAGAALRHATAMLMGQPARHRLLLLLSDGKPNDVDDYEGRYGVEDMRQAVTEARLQGINAFCLTVDRQAANYLPDIFGPRQYALLPKPELLPAVLLDWMRRLMQNEGRRARDERGGQQEGKGQRGKGGGGRGGEGGGRGGGKRRGEGEGGGGEKGERREGGGRGGGGGRGERRGEGGGRITHKAPEQRERKERGGVEE